MPFPEGTKTISVLQGQGKTDKAIKLAKQALESIQKTDQEDLDLFIENNIKEWSN